MLLMVRQPEHQFLLMRHSDRWDLPKGHSEPNETFLETALRETNEETGIAVDQITIDPDFHFDLKYQVTYKRWNNQTVTTHVRYFLGYLSEKPTLRLTEHESCQWFAWDPPHTIQTQTIDPLLSAVAAHLES